ncbi:MAG TPA: hypothetical protein VGL98_16105 [Gammaproteobacteria bacterium]
MKAAEKTAWAVGGLGFVAAALAGLDERPADGGGLVIAIASYAVGLHWIIAYLFDGTMYGALRLQPTHGGARIVVLVVGVALAFFALQYALGLGDLHI